MKFIFADSIDVVDPGYDFVADRNSAGRRPYWDDVYPHEILGYAPYDGMLVSRGIVGDDRVKGKYSESQAIRFRREGVRKFLRLDREGVQSLDIFGDCGAFTYVNEEVPPYTPYDMASFYDECGFTHGCSVDHIIFDFTDESGGVSEGTAEARRRAQITLANADEFLKETRHFSNRFTPLGVVQGWSASSMASAARRLTDMGYTYLAIGGMVPLKSVQIKSALGAIRDAIPRNTRMHVLGFAKPDEIETFAPLDITSFDTTSPLIRAFKDAKQNYFLPGEGGKLRYFTAIRVPQSLENSRLQRAVKKGVFRAEDLTRMEKNALTSLRAYDRHEADFDQTLEAVMEYSAPLNLEKPYEEVKNHTSLKTLKIRYAETLKERPWTKCSCAICAQASIEVIIFRASNRNKRRGIHNLHVYRQHLNTLDLNRGPDVEEDLFSRHCAAE
jgi:hypothetical protein